MAEILSVDPVAPQPEPIARAAAGIRSGEVVAIPTDTVYGLAADPFNEQAVEKVFAAKGRPADAPILVLVDSVAMAASLALNLPPLFHRLAQRFWPGPLTIVVDGAANVPHIVTAHTGRLGIRWPRAAIASALVAALGGPITATSANLSGQPESRSAKEVAASISSVSLILDGGPSLTARPSTVLSVSAKSWELIREGAIPRNELEEFLDAGEG